MIDVTIKRTASIAVSLVRNGAAPLAPKTLWPPPKTGESPAPLACCRRTTRMRRIETKICIGNNIANIFSSYARFAEVVIISTKLFASRLAPPTSEPSISGCDISASAFDGFTLPP